MNYLTNFLFAFFAFSAAASPYLHLQLCPELIGCEFCTQPS